MYFVMEMSEDNFQPAISINRVELAAKKEVSHM